MRFIVEAALIYANSLAAHTDIFDVACIAILTFMSHPSMDSPDLHNVAYPTYPSQAII